jgi:hypothetical protein
MLEIKAILDSPSGDILAFKTCCGLKAMDQNLELLVKNRGSQPVTVPSHFDLVLPQGSRRIANLMPFGPRRIDPGQTAAFYCTMDPELWRRATACLFYDSQGRSYPLSLHHGSPPREPESD